MRATQIPRIPDDFQKMHEDRENRNFSVWVDGEKVTVYKIRTSALPYNRIYAGNQRPISQSEIIRLVSFEGEGAMKIEVETEN